jgi:membrane fusion protein (multidrug efflux system)
MNMETSPTNPRKRRLILLALVFLAAAIAYTAHWYLLGRHHESTDDAYLAGNVVAVTPRIGGTVVAVLADSTDFVRAGQILVKLDAADARLALDRAGADLGEAVRQVRQTFSGATQQAANLALKQRELERAEADLLRRQQAIEVQAVSREEAEHARATRDQARAALDQARAQYAASEAQVAGTSVTAHPTVMQAEAHLRAAYLALSRCVVRAPESGQVAKRSVQIGQQVAAGAPLMAILPLHQVWVEANFKEDQLQGMGIGQPVELVSDLYGSAVKFHGKVAGLSPGTGSAFALLPPQNASGNWIKIVQRLPVRIDLDPEELAKHPLRVGLSMKATVDTSKAGSKPGAAVTSASVLPTRYETHVFDEDETEVSALIHRILKANQAPAGRSDARPAG